LLAIGLMSGTSLDGVDAALVEIQDHRFLLKEFIIHPFSASTKERILKNLNVNTSNVQELCSLNFELGHIFCDAMDALIQKANITYSEVDFVASHGQTVWHNPNQLGGYYSSTLQIGEPAVLAYHANVDVVSNFRTMDMAAGGMGAPLVPFADYLLFRSEEKNIALQNIGGIGNVTYLKKGCSMDEILAFDTGPGNVLIDNAMRILYNEEFDESGQMALSGKIIQELIDALKNDAYLTQSPPKTTGREKYTYEFVESIINQVDFALNNKEDIITTLSHFTALSIKINYDLFLENVDQIIVSGGGSRNRYIMSQLEKFYSGKVVTADQTGFQSDAKEAIAFVVMGYETLEGRPSNVKSATGAKDYCILGQITKAPKPKIGGFK